MHCIETAELAAVLTHHAAAIVRIKAPIRSEPLTQYWVKSRSRFDGWHHLLGELTALETAGRPLAMHSWWDDHAPMLEEIIVSDSLTRVFAALGIAYDHALDQRELEPVTHSIFISHLEARNRVLQLILFGRGGSLDQSMQLNRLRRTSERWTDRLLAQISVLHPRIANYAIDPHRFATYAKEFSEQLTAQASMVADLLCLASLRCSLKRHSSSRPASPIANSDIASSIIACLGAECFDSLGVLKTVRASRIATAQVDCQSKSATNPIFPAVMPSDHRKGFYPHAARWLQ